MGKGDIRTRRGKIWRRTYGVTRPRRWKTVVRPHAATRKVKTLKDLPKAVAEPIVKKPVVETVPVIEKVQPVIEGITAQVPQIVAEPVTGTASAAKKVSKPAVKKSPEAKKTPVAKKATAKKKK